MARGQVYITLVDPDSGRVEVQSSLETLPNLDASQTPLRLVGPMVEVHNATYINTPKGQDRVPTPSRIADAVPDDNGDFVYAPGRGGRRLDRDIMRKRRVRREHVAASHFGEVNVYYHLDRIASYIDGLRTSIGRPALPKVIALVNAHHAAVDEDGKRDGIWSHDRWHPFQGAHYRLPSASILDTEPEIPAEDGEIHFGPGRKLVRFGALPRWAGSPYRANASHNAGIIYHEYGHHLVRHTADPVANRLRDPLKQINRKAAIDEACCDYWAAVLLGSPDIWALHHEHSEASFHPRSLRSTVTMDDYDPSPSADPHRNGTIFAAALWDARTALMSLDPENGVEWDRTVLEGLYLLGSVTPSSGGKSPRSVSACREPFEALLGTILAADERLNGGRNQRLVITCFARRGVVSTASQPLLSGVMAS